MANMEGAFLAIGLSCGLILGSSINSDSVKPERVKERLVEVQDLNFDLRLALERKEAGDIGRLVLDTEASTYAFIRNSSQSCEGSYALDETGRQAELAGEPVCK